MFQLTPLMILSVTHRVLAFQMTRGLGWPYRTMRRRVRTHYAGKSAALRDTQRSQPRPAAEIECRQSTCRIQHGQMDADYDRRVSFELTVDAVPSPADRNWL